MIRLLDATTHSVASYLDPPSYAIISHVWLFPEIIHTDIIDPSVPLSTFTNPSHPKRISAAKILNSCNTLVRLYNGRVKHLWLDTICIDKRDLTELSTAINTMYKLDATLSVGKKYDNLASTITFQQYILLWLATARIGWS